MIALLSCGRLNKGEIIMLERITKIITIAALVISAIDLVPVMNK